MTDRVNAVVGPRRDTSEHVVAIEPCPRKVRVFFGEQLIAESTRVQLMHETNHLPVYYFPMEDVSMPLLSETDETSRCPHKGQARHWTVGIGERRAANAAWNYPTPIEGCPDISGLVAFHWNQMDAWYEEDEEVFGHPRSPYHRVDVLESSRHVVIELDGIVVADSRRPRCLFETTLPTRYYLPKLDVRTDLLRATGQTTRCPYKGTASYWSVVTDTQTHENIVWGYATAVPEAPKIAGLLCFFNEKVDLYVDGELQQRPRTSWS